MIVKGDSASLKIPELDLEVPPNTQKGSVNSLEGFIQTSIEGLEKEQPVRRVREREGGASTIIIIVGHSS